MSKHVLSDPVGDQINEGSKPRICVRDLTVAFGSFVLMSHISFDVNAGDIFMIMGGSGCGKSTLLRVLMGLKQPAQGLVQYNGRDFWGGTENDL